MKNLKLKSNNKGITLVALVITIIVLIILAGVSISMLLGDDGIIQKAKEAAEKTDKAVQKEQQDLQNLLDQLNGSLSDTKSLPKIAEVIESGNQFNENTPLEDEYGNQVVIPSGFHIAMPNASNGIVYDYTGNGTPSVQDGIVIEDNDGNQFVWIPVGTIKNKEDDENGTTTTITLGRYEFDEETGEPNEYKNTSYIEETPAEHTSSGYKNTVASNITDFITSANTNKGYYLARYEASYRDGTRPYSIKSEGTPADNTAAPSSYSTKQLWNWITQPDAANAAKAMYTSSDFTSDLVNSYAWDTTIVFIQKYSEGNSAYSRQTGLNYVSGKKYPDNTGERTGTTDKVCNIYDMASNCAEWTTETYASSGSYCVFRGGKWSDRNYYTSYRIYNNNSNSFCGVSFRITLYI